MDEETRTDDQGNNDDDSCFNLGVSDDDIDEIIENYENDLMSDKNVTEWKGDDS